MFQWPLYPLVSRLIACLLLTASWLKLITLLMVVSFPGSRWFTALVAASESLLGVWLLVGFYPRWSRRVTLACFVGFLHVALYQQFDQQPSCGCFGPLQVAPWVTALIDLGCIVALLVSPPVPGDSEKPGMARWAILGISAAVVLPTAHWLVDNNLDGTPRTSSLDDRSALLIEQQKREAVSPAEAVLGGDETFKSGDAATTAIPWSRALPLVVLIDGGLLVCFWFLRQSI